MSATLLYVLSLLIVFMLSAIGIVYARQALKKKKEQYENRIRSLEQARTAANAQVAKEVAQLNAVQETTNYEKYSGLVLAQMDRAVIIIDQNRSVGFMNNYAKQFLDFASEVGQSYKEVIHIRAAGETESYALFDAAFAGKLQHIPDNTELVSQHGTFPISGTILPLMTGQIVAAVVFIFENNSKQAARVKEEQGFFSAASHELRTPLTIIRMTVSLLREKFASLSPEKIAEHLRRTDETTERLVKLVNDFLNISRIDQGRLEMKIEKFDMVTLTDEVIANLALLARERKLFVQHETDAEKRLVAGDRAKAAEVLTNLMSNSLKYTIQGGLTITHSSSNTTLTTTITDTGPGIPKELQSLLFKRFGQVGRAREQDPTKGSGLGLYISKRLAELMRGDVQLVKSEPGMGSAFAFILPLELAQEIP